VKPDAFHPSNRAATAWADSAEYEKVRKLLDDEPQHFEIDRARARTESVLLPDAETGEPLAVPAFILFDQPKSALDKYWVREVGFPFFICPKEPLQEAVSRRVILSLDPHYRTAEGRAPSLRGLGFRLEQEETRIRAKKNPEGRDDRRGQPRYPDGYCSNDDPWYDGRAHGHTIVDGPHSGTAIPLERIIEISTSGRFWEIPVVEATVTLVWMDRDSHTAASSRGAKSLAASRPPFEGASGSLSAFYEDIEDDAAKAFELADVGLSAAELEALGFSVRTHRRRRLFPGRPDVPLAPPARILTLRAGSGATLEALARFAESTRRPGRSPAFDYCVARVRVGTHFSSPALEDRLLVRLAGGVLAPIASAGTSDSDVLVHSHAVVVRHRGPLPPEGEPDPIIELLLYVAFLHEALTSFSTRIAGIAPSGGETMPALDSGALKRLRADLIRFQSRDFTLNTSRVPCHQEVFTRLVEAVGLLSHYREVQSGLDRLADLEQQAEAERRSRADTIAEGILFAIAVAGLMQTVVAVLTWSHSARWPITGGVLLLGLAAWGLVARVRGKK